MSPRLFSILVILLLVLTPLIFIDAMTVALGKLGINPGLAPWLVLMMFVGSLINIPVFREPADDHHSRHPFDAWGIGHYFPQLEKQLAERAIAVNVGGCVIPLLLVLYEIIRIRTQFPEATTALVLAVLINILVCYFSARPVEKVGIVMPALLPGAVAALTALVLIPELAPPVAFCAGVLGPVIGADLLHLDKIRQIQVGMASIGGAGTFDGIVISGLVAVLLT